MHFYTRKHGRKCKNKIISIKSFDNINNLETCNKSLGVRRGKLVKLEKEKIDLSFTLGFFVSLCCASGW